MADKCLFIFDMKVFYGLVLGTYSETEGYLTDPEFALIRSEIKTLGINLIARNYIWNIVV
ncbi:hypothetical protein CXF95_26975 [Paraglaciecola sp. MB-3u-78]|nr:hypothetical protein CXF95_26975 [Paraglaciecola sp. MB-3u-78]